MRSSDARAELLALNDSVAILHQTSKNHLNGKFESRYSLVIFQEWDSSAPETANATPVRITKTLVEGVEKIRMHNNSWFVYGSKTIPNLGQITDFEEIAKIQMQDRREILMLRLSDSQSPEVIPQEAEDLSDFLDIENWFRISAEHSIRAEGK